MENEKLKLLKKISHDDYRIGLALGVLEGLRFKLDLDADTDRRTILGVDAAIEGLREIVQNELKSQCHHGVDALYVCNSCGREEQK